MLKLSPEAKAQLRDEQRAGRATVRKARVELEAKRQRDEARRLLRARLPRALAKAARERQAAIDAAVAQAIDRAARRAALLAELKTLPKDAFVAPPLAAAYIDSTPSVLHCWRSQRRGPRYHGANAFIRYTIADLDEWMRTRSNEVIEPPEGLFDTSGPPRLVQSDGQSKAIEQHELNMK
jgi:hypothetical protein